MAQPTPTHATTSESPTAFAVGGARHTRSWSLSAPLALWMIVLLVAVTAALLVGTGRVWLAALPLLAGLTAVALWWLPVRAPLFGVLALAMLADISGPVPIPESNLVLWPFRYLRLVLLENLNTLTGISALRISGIEVILMGLVLLMLVRIAVVMPEDVESPARPLAPLVVTLGVSVLALLAAEAWGISRGGDIRQSFWQIRYIFWLPVLSIVAMLVVRRLSHLKEIALLLSAVAVVKVAVGTYVYTWSTANDLGIPHSVTSHADSMLFAVVIALWSAVLTMRPTAGRLMVGLPMLAAMLLGIVVNNRRTAYVSVAIALLLLLVHLSRTVRRRALLTLLAVSPMLLGYLALGKSRSGGLFAPAAAVWSVLQQDDSSSDSRDVENYNLTLTIRGQLPLGSGFGHPYAEGPSAYDLSEIFAQFRFVAHNSVLWLLGILGPVGFALLWMPLVVAIFFATRAHALATQPFERIGAYMVIATVATYQVQAWADMGTQGWTGTTLVALAFATTAVLVHRTDAWPKKVQPHASGEPT